MDPAQAGHAAQMAALQVGILAQAMQSLQFKPHEPCTLKGDESDRWEFDIWSFKLKTYLEAMGITNQQVAIQAAVSYTDLHALRWYQARCQRYVFRPMVHP